MRISDRSFLRVPLVFTLALTTRAAMSQPLPEPVSREGVPYATGGVGVDGAREFQALFERITTVARDPRDHSAWVDLKVECGGGD